ncbi:uncharacterized protein BP01DRAFT_392338 [Aspergillus saccharolyticus JOP 1030-1]|uniref:Uncharacterized protein n=1 Tax=Aspergillus saccharolyticus JOP 1030-1 TaxID=1450539 RepID=A0A318ZB54_9EURO|nr:hypothetical protein BP01DRAFT_392338 [Aspergillus saccharolyticus JOP 1030-1]PYH44675.1 hypothetical protein BP01DRAFT_392338 [Aspergillus saccharolyticus JOP 1030-1]
MLVLGHIVAQDWDLSKEEWGFLHLRLVCKAFKILNLNEALQKIHREDVDPIKGDLPPDEKDNVPLSLAARVVSLEITRLLLQRNDLDPKIWVEDSYQRTAYDWADHLDYDEIQDVLQAYMPQGAWSMRTAASTA